MGCADCKIDGGHGGCDDRKSDQRALFATLIDRLYPDRTWGRLDEAASFRAGVGRAEARRLGRAMAELLQAPTIFRDGGPDDLCSFVYVLCLGREPSLVDVRDGRARLDGSEVEVVRERYLRVALSTVARLGAVQEVELTLERSPGEGLAVVREAPRAGVYEESLLKRLRRLTALLEASDVRYCDFGLLDKPLAEAVPDLAAIPTNPTNPTNPPRPVVQTGAYVERWGVEPRLANWLFFAEPPTTAAYTVVPLAAA